MRVRSTPRPAASSEKLDREIFWRCNLTHAALIAWSVAAIAPPETRSDHDKYI
jgi:hypothetical protein